MPSGVTSRTFLITGANSGIGKTAAEALAAKGGKLVLAARSSSKMQPVLESIRQRFPSSEPQFLEIDVSDLQSVRSAATRFLDGGTPLDVLINNAGVAGTRELSRQGFELTYATNHIGPFLLTNLLLPRLTESVQGRIVNVSSEGHRACKALDWSKLEPRSVPVQQGFRDYAATKLMNVLHASELARRLSGTRVTTYSLHPGAVATNVWRALPGPLAWFMKLFMLNEVEGARTTVYCATDPGLASVSGRYYEKEKERWPTRLAQDPALAAELWRRTEAAIESVSPR